MATASDKNVVIAGLENRQQCYRDVAFTELMDAIQPLSNQPITGLDYPVEPGNDDELRSGMTGPVGVITSLDIEVDAG